MATLFGILAAVVLTLSAWIGYRNYVEYEAQINARQKQEGITINKKNELADTKKKLDDEIAAKEKLIAENEELAKTESELDTKIASLESDLKSKEDLIKSNEATLVKQRDATKNLPDIDVLIPQITATRKKIASLKTDIDGLKAKVANLEQKKTQTAGEIADKKEVNDQRVAGKSLSSLNTTIRSVYRSWGFVTLNGGDTQGVTPGSTLDVIRNGEVIAKLKVTAVEPSKAAADIVMGEDAGVVSLRSGDRVVAELDESKKVKPNAESSTELPAAPANDDAPEAVDEPAEADEDADAPEVPADNPFGE